MPGTASACCHPIMSAGLAYCVRISHLNGRPQQADKIRDQRSAARFLIERRGFIAQIVARSMGRQLATTATNLYDFRQLFTLWAGICVKALAEVKAVSPVPKDLSPNQSL